VTAHSELLELYDEALPHVYGFLLRRCGSITVAEDLTSETFLAAVDAVRRPDPPAMHVGWLVGVARHKLADHWRKQARTPDPVEDVPEPDPVDVWDAELDRVVSEKVLSEVSDVHRSVLVLRYIDDLTVPECARQLGRTVHATEALLVRARQQFRNQYTEPRGDRS
jgi:RNA polymerase sigma-70 factor (ECF subfamily)